MYNNYEEYMRSVLGYNTMPNTYRESESYYYDTIGVNQNLQEVNKLYPEIYRLVYPMVQKICSNRNAIPITEEMLNQMVEEIYNVLESRDEELENNTTNSRNGDVKNTKAKETRRQNQSNNYLLRDLIRILIIRELLAGGRTGFVPGGGPGMMAEMLGRPPMPGNNGMGGMPPIMRPGNPRMF